MAIVFELAQNNGSSLIISHVEPGEREADEVLRINAYGYGEVTEVTLEYDLDSARLLHEHLGRIIEAARQGDR